MRYSTLLMAAVASLAMAAPMDKRQSLADLLGLSASQSLNSNNLLSQFSSNSLSANDLLILLQQSQSFGGNFGLDQFNSQFSSSFNDQQILQLLLALEGNQFGNSNFQNLNLGVANSLDLSQFSNQFNSQFGASWSNAEIEALLLQLGLIQQSQLNLIGGSSLLNSQLLGSNNVFGNLVSSSNVGNAQAAAAQVAAPPAAAQAAAAPAAAVVNCA